MIIFNVDCSFEIIKKKNTDISNTYSRLVGE